MDKSPFPLKTLTFQPVVLQAADSVGQDWHFQGALLGKSQDEVYDYFLYHTTSNDKNWWMVGARIEKTTGKVEAETWGMIDIDMMESFYSQAARFDIFMQCQFPGYELIGAPLDGKGAV